MLLPSRVSSWRNFPGRFQVTTSFPSSPPLNEICPVMRSVFTARIRSRPPRASSALATISSAVCAGSGRAPRTTNARVSFTRASLASRDSTRDATAWQDSKQKKRHARKRALEMKGERLFRGLVRSRLGCGLRLRGFGFFHGFLGFRGALGASFGALLALLVEGFLAAQQFDEGLVGAVAFLPA